MTIRQLLIHLAQVKDLDSEIELVLDTEDGRLYSSVRGLSFTDLRSISTLSKGAILRASYAERIKQ